MLSHDASRAFLSIVCKNLNFNDPVAAIEEFLSRDSSLHDSLLKGLLGDSGSGSSSDPYGTPFGVAFYKLIVSDRRLFKVPTSYGTTVLQKQKQRTESAQASFTEAGTFTVLGVSDLGGQTRRQSTNVDLDRQALQKVPSVRESMISSNEPLVSTASGETEAVTGGVTNPVQPAQFLLVARMYPRESLMATPLSMFGSGQAVEEGEIMYFYAIRNYLTRSGVEAMMRAHQISDSQRAFSLLISTGCLRGSLLECAHRVFSKVYLRLLAYNMQRREMYSEGESREVSGSGQSRSGGSVSGGGTGGGVAPSGRENENTENSADSRTSRGSGQGENSKRSASGSTTGGGAEDTQRLRDEFSVTMYKFSTVLEETITALQGVFNLEEPDFMPSENYRIDPPRDFAMIPKISRLFRVWVELNEQINQVLTNLNKPRPISTGPLEEVDHWRYRCKILTAVAEALRTKTARWVINAWSTLNPDAEPYSRGAEIKALMLEAKDNSRFLLLVERHFKNVQFGPSFDSVADTIPAMVQSLRLIWTISRGYNKDERMGPLLQRIAWALCDRVVSVMEISRLFSQSIRTILREVKAAIRMLTLFEDTYLQERQRVEATSQDNRWEFDRKILFGDIHYMKKILTDIFEMAKDLPCPFLPKNEKIWLKVKGDFEDHASMIDAKAKNFINDYFAHIRGPTSAFDLLEKFKSVKARAAITCLLKDKYRDVLRSFGNELLKVELKFKELRDTPLVAHYLPPIAGSISWTRLILSTVKASILRFINSQPDILDEDEGKAVKARYVSLADELRKYEISRHKSWETEVNAIVSLRLSQPVLFKHTIQIAFDQVSSPLSAAAGIAVIIIIIVITVIIVILVIVVIFTVRANVVKRGGFSVHG
ncbi:Dynein-1-alpha heavy chain flagellar inner arm I1 complex [Fasciola gigantica]|uniref:Dynein-1-alpha heavy chain flagellar inner arm I1 complex n=1 Tax=Fasciola gigantica TaxID=46835 RepID=A0A504YE24_FASGI|nr:Dynein-1-alpha heavy chain flagellar inner arm I1 complex [Fasciola gigantica]